MRRRYQMRPSQQDLAERDAEAPRWARAGAPGSVRLDRVVRRGPPVLDLAHGRRFRRQCWGEVLEPPVNGQKAGKNVCPSRRATARKPRVSRSLTNSGGRIRTCDLRV